MMALKILHPAAATSSSSHLFHPFSTSTKIDKLAFSATRCSTSKINSSSFCRYPLSHWITTKASGVVGETITDYNSAIKDSLYDQVQGINRGIFGVQSERKAEIEKLVKQLESHNPTREPTEHLDKVAGKWKLVYSTITILGAKRTKLGLRDFITLGDFVQTIDVSEGKAVNVIEFSARGLNLLKGQLRIEATFKIASKTVKNVYFALYQSLPKVDISFDSSSITPDQLMNVFKKNYELLLRVFNPEGWLDITYVDDTLRIGRDDKGNIFVLERSM